MGSRIRKSLIERFLESFIIEDNGCWEWQRNFAKGYGRFWAYGKAGYSHRWSYEQAKGPIPEGLQIDHLCRNPKCCNPFHLEAVTHQENMKRGIVDIVRHKKKTHCRKGHEFTPENIVMSGKWRTCRICSNARQRRYYAATYKK